MSDDFRAPSRFRRAWALALIIVAVVVSTISRSVGIRLGWPGQYWQQGGAVLGAYLLACVLLAILFVLLVRAFIATRLMPPVCTLTLLVAVILILRCLPSAESGVQVLPSLPWNYSGWFSPVIALGAWVFLIFVICSLLAGDPPQETGIFLGWMLVLTLPLSLCEVPPVPSAPERAPVVEPLGDHRKQIAELRSKRNEAQRILEVLHRDRDMLVERLRRLGVRSSADLKDIPEARPLAEELVEVVGQIQEQEKTVRRLDMAVVEGESMLRRIERQEVLEKGGLAQEEEEHLIRSKLEMKESLPIKDDVVILKADDVLDEVLKGNSHDRKP